MNLNNFAVQIPTNQQKITIIPIEVHYSNRKLSNGFCMRTWRSILKRLEDDKFCYAIFPGDIRDTDRPSSRERKEYAYHEHERKPALTEEDENDQLILNATIIKDLKPVTHKILGMLDGDHFKRYADGSTSTQYICQKLGIPQAYLGERLGWVSMTFNRLGGVCSLSILVRHGVGGTGRIGSDINRLIAQNEQFEADLFIGGHTHKKWFYSMPTFYAGKYEIKQKTTGYARAGSLLRNTVKGQTLYNELSECSPLLIGYPEIYIYLKRSRCLTNGQMVITGMQGLN